MSRRALLAVLFARHDPDAHQEPDDFVTQRIGEPSIELRAHIVQQIEFGRRWCHPHYVTERCDAPFELDPLGLDPREPRAELLPGHHAGACKIDNPAPLLCENIQGPAGRALGHGDEACYRRRAARSEVGPAAG
jgi:hypothetical protein